MRKTLSIIMLLIIGLLCCACASKDMATAEVNELTPAEAEDNLYSMERSAEPAEEFPDIASSDAKPLICVTFTQHTGSANAADGTKLFISRSNVPQIVTDEPSVNHWLASSVADIKDKTSLQMQTVEQWAQEDYQSRAGDEPFEFYAYSYYTDISIERLDNQVISALQVDSIYSGGAHPNYVQKAYNLDLSTQKQLSLADVVFPESADTLRQQVLLQLEKQFGGLEESGLYADYPEIVASYFAISDLTPYWYFTGNGLVIYFNCYDIAPYAAGIIKVELFYEDLYGLLKPEYFPESIDATEGSINVLSAVGNRRLLTVPAAEEPLYLGTNQTLYDVKIWRLTGWITDDVPIMGQMIFAANRLTASDAVAIPVTNDAGYLLTHKTGAGQLRMIAINHKEIQEIPAKIAE